MTTRKIGVAVLALAALVLTGCGAVKQQVKDAISSAPTVTLGDIPTTLPNLNDVAGAVLDEELVKAGFQPNAAKTEYTKGAGVVVVEEGMVKTVRLKFDQGVVECPPAAVLAANYATGIDTLLGLGYSGVLSKHSTICKAAK